MPNKEKLMRAQFYTNKLLDGVSPIDNSILPDNDIVRNPKVTNFLTYISSLLDQIEENDFKIAKAKGPRQDFSFDGDNVNDFGFSDTPLTITEFTKRINEVIRGENKRRLRRGAFTTFLIQKGLLCYETDDDEKKSARPTEKGKDIGILTQLRSYEDKEYIVVLYDIHAQKYILNELKCANI